MSDMAIAPRPQSLARPLVTTLEPGSVARRGPQRPLQRGLDRGDWRCVEYSRRWLAAGLGVGVTGALALGEALSSGHWPAALATGGAFALSAAYATLVEPARPVLTRHELRLARLPARLHGLRLMQLSDMHLGARYSRNNLRRAVAMVKREQPDLLVLTGDFVQTPEAIGELAGLLDGITAPLGCYAVLGNHDYWEGPQEVVDALAQVGVETLINESRLLNWHGTRFALLGIDEPWSGAPNLGLALRDVPDTSFKLLLAHAPEAADEAAAHGIDVQLSGHTHGGHMHLPLLGAFALPRHGQRYPIGFAQVGNTLVYTNRGLGGTALRLNCAPEATLLTLLSAKIA